jgi:hypothetical protein
VGRVPKSNTDNAGRLKPPTHLMMDANEKARHMTVAGLFYSFRFAEK